MMQRNPSGIDRVARARRLAGRVRADIGAGFHIAGEDPPELAYTSFANDGRRCRLIGHCEICGEGYVAEGPSFRGLDHCKAEIRQQHERHGRHCPRCGAGLDYRGPFDGRAGSTGVTGGHEGFGETYMCDAGHWFAEIWGALVPPEHILTVIDKENPCSPSE